MGAVHGCGGVGLSAIMIASALGAKVVAVDITEEKLQLALAMGATSVINATHSADVVEAIKQHSGGGVQVSVDAVGFPEACFNSVSCLAKRGKHIQLGLLSPDDRNAQMPMDLIVARELQICGSHGMQAHRYPQMLDMVLCGALQPQKLVSELISLDEAPAKLVDMDRFSTTGITVINRF